MSDTPERIHFNRSCEFPYVSTRAQSGLIEYVLADLHTAMTAERDALATAGRAAYLRLLELARQDMLNKSETEDMEKLGAALRVISGKETA